MASDSARYKSDFWFVRAVTVHPARVDFGDNEVPAELPVVESHATPLGRGKICITYAHIDWQNLIARAQARNDKITMFLGVNEWKGGSKLNRWDTVNLYQIQPC